MIVQVARAMAVVLVAGCGRLRNAEARTVPDVEILERIKSKYWR
jgi:hypothetical protein